MIQHSSVTRDAVCGRRTAGTRVSPPVFSCMSQTFHQGTEPVLVARSGFRVAAHRRLISVDSLLHHLNDALLPDRLKQVTKASPTLEVFFHLDCCMPVLP
jgi:hypothetical protein